MPASTSDQPVSRATYLKGVRSLVVKLGSQLLSNSNGGLNKPLLDGVVRQIAGLVRDRGMKVTIVSSGAVAAGMAELKLARRPTDLAQVQAVAAIGQRRLMEAWGVAFEPYNTPVAQVLLTREDIDRRVRYLNLRNTIAAVHDLGGIPIINENDTVSTDELVKITFGDNDILASLVTHALRANLLVLMTVVDGLLDADSKPVRLVRSVDQARALVRVEKSALGKGGMRSKIEAARVVTRAGEAMVVVDGRMENVLTRVLAGEELGTLFVPAARKQSSRLRWIGSVRPAGAIRVDAGCVQALVEQHRSLLAAGVTGADGAFKRGDVVEIVAPDGVAIARGLTNYAAGDVIRIAGKKTAEIRSLLKEAAYDEVIHCDNLVVG